MERSEAHADGPAVRPYLKENHHSVRYLALTGKKNRAITDLALAHSVWLNKIQCVNLLIPVHFPRLFHFTMPDPKIARFTALLEKNPDNALFRFSLAQALDKADRTDEALAHYQHCAAGKADWMMPRILLGKLHLKLGQPTAARVALEEALKLAIEQSHEEPEVELRTLIATLD